MKVTFCTYDGHNCINGVNAWLRRLLPELQSREIQIQVLFIAWAPVEQCTTLPYLRQIGVDCQEIPLPYYTERQAGWILEKLAAEPPDIFVPNCMVPALYASRWVREAGIPTVGVLHNDDAQHRAIISEFVVGESAYQLSSVVGVSQFLEQQVLQQKHQGTLVKRISHGVPLPPQVASAPTERLRLAYVGRLAEEQKRISELTRALCRVLQEVSNTEAVIYGSGPDQPAVEQILQEEGKGLPIYLAGLVESEQVQEHLLNCQVLVLLSDYEGLGLAVMEAMACGVVPICLRIRCGIPDLVEDGVTGLLVSDRGDDFVAAVRRLRHEPGLWERLSQQARAKMQTEYSNKVCADRWEKFLWELHQGTGPRRQIKVPSQFNLPPVNPDLASLDPREPPLHIKILRKSKTLLEVSGFFH